MHRAPFSPSRFLLNLCTIGLILIPLILVACGGEPQTSDSDGDS